MLVSYNELCEFVERGVIEGVDLKDVNGTSIDVHLGPEILVERSNESMNQIVSLRDKERLNMASTNISNGHYDLRPGEFILAHTMENFNLPSDISIEFKLNSSGARTGLDNALATWGDPYWSGSVLTLELKNLTQWHTIRLHDGVRIGQIIFWKSAPVPKDRGYAVRGRYMNDKSVSGVKM